MIEKKNVGGRLKEFRADHNLKQIDIVNAAADIGLKVSRSLISKVESGDLWPSFELVSVLIINFNIDPKWFLNGESEPSIAHTENIFGENSDRFCEMIEVMKTDEYFYHRILMCYLEIKMERKKENLDIPKRREKSG